MEKLIEYLQENIKRTPKEEKQRLTFLKQLYEENIVLSEQVMKLQTKLDTIESQQKRIVDNKESEMAKHRAEIISLRKSFNSKIKSKM